MSALDMQRRRAALLARSARLRGEFSQDAAVLASRLGVVDRLRALQRSEEQQIRRCRRQR